MSSNAVVSALLAAALGSGCATVVKGGRNELILHSASDDLKAYAMGEELALSRSGTSDGKARFKASVPKEAHELKLRTEGLDLPVPLQNHVGVGWVVADIVLTGFIGLLIDGITSRWTEFDDVDVARALSTARAAGSAVPARDTGPARTPPRQEPLLSRSLPPPSRQEPPAERLSDRTPSQSSSQGQGAPVISAGKLAVLDFKSYANDFKPEDVRYFSDLVRGATLRAAPGLEVMTRENLLVLLKATGKDLGQCEGECEVDTGRRIGADAVVSGDVLKVGSRYKMSLKLHETHGGRLLSTSVASGKTIDELDEAVQRAAEDLLRPPRR